MLVVVDESITVNPLFDNSTPTASASKPPPGANAISQHGGATPIESGGTASSRFTWRFLKNGGIKPKIS